MRVKIPSMGLGTYQVLEIRQFLQFEYNIYSMWIVFLNVIIAVELSSK